MVFQPQSNKKRRREEKEKEEKRRKKKEEKGEKGGEKKGKNFISLFLISKSSGELTSLWPKGRIQWLPSERACVDAWVPS